MPGVAHDPRGGRLVHRVRELEIRAHDPGRDELQRVLDARRELEGRLLELELAGFDLREVEDLVDDRQQVLATQPDRLGHFALLAIETGRGHQIRHADDGVHRRADLVTHVRQELGLGLSGRLGRHLGVLVLEILDRVPEPDGHHVEGTAEGADLVHRADGGANGEIALTHPPRDPLHLDHGPGDPSRHEDADASRHPQSHEAAEEHHAMEHGVGGGHHGERQGQPQHADRAIAVPDGQAHVEERLVHGGARAQAASHATGQAGPYLGSARVVLHGGEALGRHLGVGEHASVWRDERHPRVRRSAGTQHEGVHGGGARTTG